MTEPKQDATKPWPTYFVYMAFAAGFLLFCILRILLQAYEGINSDVAWALIIARKWLLGDVPYQDFLESNPPGVLLLYLPFGWLAAWSGLTLQQCMLAGISFLILLSNSLILIMLRDVGDQQNTTTSRLPHPLGFTCLLLLLEQLGPGAMYGQREHIAFILVLPFLILQNQRLSGQQYKAMLTLPCGLLCALALCIKPNFALFLIGAGLLVLLRYGLSRVLQQSELYVIVIVLALYGLLIATRFPLYREKFLFFLINAYIPVREPISELILEGPIVLFVILAIPILIHFYEQRTQFWQNVRPVNAMQTASHSNSTLQFTIITFLAAFGGVLDFFIQGKGYLYQGLPGLLFAILSFASIQPLWAISFSKFTFSKRIFTNAHTRKTILCFLIMALFLIPFFLTKQSTADLQKAILRVNELSKVPLTLAQLCSRDYEVPRLALATNAEYLSSANANWLTYYSRIATHANIPNALKERLNEFIKIDHDHARDDIAVKKPKLVLVHTESDVPDPVLPAGSQSLKCVQLFWPGDTEIAQALSQYSYIEHVDEYSLYLRKDEK